MGFSLMGFSLMGFTLIERAANGGNEECSLGGMTILIAKLLWMVV